MIYRLKELKGDTIAVPQLVFSKLGIAEEYNVRVALYVLATGITDPDKICADLKLRSRISAESALSFWAGAGLLERYEENAAPGEEPSAPAPMTWAEIAAASRTDPMISSLIDCAQTGFARPLTHREMEKLVNLYMQEGFAPETVMLCTAYVASTGRSTMAAVVHELKVWRTEGVETGEQADAHLKLLALRQSREQYVSGLLEIPESELTLAVSKLLEAELIQRGYTVLMTRTEQDVNISNSERAAVANDANADAFVRIHANGSENSGANGALTICQTAANPYNSDLYEKSRALSDAVLDELTANAGCRKEYVWETDTMSGINWCRVPVTIVEIGYMTNAAEDALLATDDYRSLIAVGIANGIDRYFRELSEN